MASVTHHAHDAHAILTQVCMNSTILMKEHSRSIETFSIGLLNSCMPRVDRHGWLCGLFMLASLLTPAPFNGQGREGWEMISSNYVVMMISSNYVVIPVQAHHAVNSAGSQSVMQCRAVPNGAVSSDAISC